MVAATRWLAGLLWWQLIVQFIGIRVKIEGLSNLGWQSNTKYIVPADWLLSSDAHGPCLRLFTAGTTRSLQLWGEMRCDDGTWESFGSVFMMCGDRLEINDPTHTAVRITLMKTPLQALGLHLLRFVGENRVIRH